MNTLDKVTYTLDARIVYVCLWIYTLVVFGLIIGYSVLPNIVKNDVPGLMIQTYLTIVTGYAINHGVMRWKKKKDLKDSRKGQFWIYFCWLVILLLGVLMQFDQIHRISWSLTEIEAWITVIFFGGRFWKHYLEKRIENGKI